MDQILSGMEGTICYLDNILLFSKNTQEIYHIVDAVLKRLSVHGVNNNNKQVLISK